MSEVRLVCGSSEHASNLAADLVGRVALVVTSPPYHNAISYTTHQSDRSLNYREREETDYSGEYLSLLNRVWNQAGIMLRPGGILAVNVGTVLDGGTHIPLPQDIQRQLLGQGWLFVRNIYWNKVTAGVKRAGSVIKHALPGYWYPNIMTEHIIVVAKPGGRMHLNKDFPPEWLENTWDLAPVPPRTVDHPAPYPEDLPHRLIRMVTEVDDWVMDPFNGAGATTKAAHDLDRHGLGFDISDQYIGFARSRLSNLTQVRRSQLFVTPVRTSDFTPTARRGDTRHGAGVNARRRSRS